MAPLRKQYKLVFHNGSFKKKSIKVWYSEAQKPRSCGIPEGSDEPRSEDTFPTFG